MTPTLVHALLNATLDFDMPILRAALIEAMHPPTQNGFEYRVRVLSEVLRIVAEDWYKPILKCALTVSFRSRGRLDSAVPKELGALLGDMPGFQRSSPDDLIQRNSNIRIPLHTATLN